MGKLGLAFRCFFRVLREPEFANHLQSYRITAESGQDTKTDITASELLSLLQEEGRLVDFLQEDISEFDDCQVGGAARDIHAGCKKAIAALFKISPVVKEREGEMILVDAGFDPKAIELVGQVTGEPPFRGTVKHHGWKIEKVKDTLQKQYIVAQAEIEV